MAIKLILIFAFYSWSFGCGNLQLKSITSKECLSLKMTDSLSSFLNNKYPIEFNVSGTAQISKGRLAYLLNDLPLATLLINHYRKTPYIFEYIDSTKQTFNVAKGEKIKGVASVIGQNSNNSPIFYFGEGVVKTGPITIRGPALVKFTFEQNNQNVKYSIDVIIMLKGSISHYFMNSNMIRNIIFKKINEVMNDILISAEKFSMEQKIPRDWSKENKRKLEELLQIK